MSYPAVVFKVMIASPGDVPAERNIIREVLSEWNVVNADLRRQVLLPVGWETHSIPEMGGRPQALISSQILHDCDLLVGVFWTRIGTATGEYDSGTVEEIEEHVKTGRPTMLYFSSAPAALDTVDPDQYRRLKEFRANCQQRGLQESYDDLSDFRSKFYRQLQLKINKDPYFRAGDAADLSVGEDRPFPSLTKEAAYLLKEAVADLSGTVLCVATLGGQILQVRGKNLIEQGNARSSAIWLGALEELEQSELLAAATAQRNVFRVTRKGYDAADRLPK